MDSVCECGHAQDGPSSTAEGQKDANVSLHEKVKQTGTFKLPGKHLLKKKREFDKVYRQGKRLHGKGFTLIFINNGLSYNRLGISIHRKLRGAVKRNRIKRILKETFRKNRSLFPETADIVIAVRPDFNSTTPDEIHHAIADITAIASSF